MKRGQATLAILLGGLLTIAFVPYPFYVILLGIYSMFIVYNTDE